MRSFDPEVVGDLECRTWVHYYRHEWWAFLRAAVLVVRHTFGLSWPRTVQGAWWVLRANQKWAPVPDNDPAAARAYMRRFYAMVARTHSESFDVDEAARLEVEWWRAHRAVQRGASGREPAGVEALVVALQRLYAHTYGVPEADVRLAAQERAEAMRLSDEWVAAGNDLTSPLVGEERAVLVRSYRALLEAVRRPGTT
ncbi:MAG TPA: hypothetical protein VMI11_03165 [Actinomycetes bacterium]|nr:hypothetical protein [Actinomycetes bacterium]